MHPYKNADLPADQRVADLLGRMTLEEKVAQMMCVWNEKATKLVDADGHFDDAKARAAFADGRGLGQVGRPSDTGGGTTARGQADLTNAIQRFFIENSRLGIPVVFHEECLHGHAAPDATSFPQPIGLAATFNPASSNHLRDDCRGSAVRGTHQALTPVVDVARDPLGPRRGHSARIPLVSRMGVAAVRNFRDDLRRQNARHGDAQALRGARPAKAA
jgi:beta-glucosidase